MSDGVTRYTYTRENGNTNILTQSSNSSTNDPTWSKYTPAYKNPLTMQYNNTANKLNLTNVATNKANTETATTPKSEKVLNTKTAREKTTLGTGRGGMSLEDFNAKKQQAVKEGSGAITGSAKTWLSDLLNVTNTAAKYGEEKLGTPDNAFSKRWAQQHYGHTGEEVRKKNEEISDNLYDKGSQEIDAARKSGGEGNKTMEVATDLVSNATQMGLDIGTSLLTGIPTTGILFARSAGGGMREAKQAGATTGEQLAYGAVKGGIETVTEKLFDGLGGAYGKGFLDSKVAKSKIGQSIVGLIGDSPVKQSILKLGASILSEAGEEGLSSAVDPLAKRIYDDGKAINELFNSPEARQEYFNGIGYDALIGGIMGGFFSSGSVFRANADAVATLESQIAAENANGTQAQGTPTALQQILAKDSKYSKAASEIIHNPEALAEYEANYGKVEGNSVAEMERNLAAALYLTTTKANTTESTQTVPETLEGANNPMAMPNGEMSLSPTDSYVRGLIMNGEAEEILSSEDNITAYEKLTGEKLPSNKEKAYQQIMARSRNTFSGETDLSNNAITDNFNTAESTAMYDGDANVVLDGNKNTQNINAETTATETQQITPQTEQNATEGQNVQETQERGTTEQANTQNTQENAQNNPQVATTEVAREVAEQMKDLPPKERVAGNTENVITNNSMSEEVRNDVAQNPDKYNVLHNKDTLKRAIEIIDKNPDGWRGAVEELRNALAEAKNGKKIAPEFVPLTKILVNELYNTHNEVDRQTALQLNSDMAAELTWVGKFAQANAILRNADPITARMAIDKFIAKANKYLESKYGKNYKKKYTAALTQAEIERINATDFMAHPEELGNIIQDVSRRIGKEAPTSIKEKLFAISRGGMLSLPATHVGNLVANVPTAGMRKTNNFFAGVMQALDSKGIKLEGEQIPTQTQDGKWTAKVGDRTIVADTEQECKAIAVAEAYGRTRSAWASRQSTKVAREIYNGIKDNITEGTDKYGSPTSGYINQTMLKPLKISLFGKDIVNLTEWGTKNADKLTQIFKERFGVNAEDIFDASASQTYLNFIYWAMENEDKPFVRWAFVDSLASYCEARGITSAENVTEEAIAHATADALYYTYKNGNFISELISEIKHGKNKNPQTQAIADAFGMLAEHKLPFVTTLTNIGLMGIEHNPFTAGAKAIYEGAFLDANKTQVFDTLSKGFTGTLVIGLGMGLRSLGLLTGSGSEDDKRKKAWKRATGQQANSLLGKYDLSQLEPFVSLLSLGADLVDSYADPSNDDSPLQRLGNAITGSVNGFFGMEMMQNLAELFGEDSSYNSGNVAQDFIDSLSNDLPSRYIPNVWKGTVNAQDNTNRYFQYGDTWGERIVNAFKYYAGIDREKFPEKANVKGETSKGNPLTSAIDAMLYPGQINQGTMNEEDKFLEKMEKELGTTAVYPMQFYPGDEFTDSNTGEKVTLKAENTADFQKTYSNTYYSALAKLRTSDYFNSLDKDGKKAAISEVGSFSKDMAIAKAFESEGLEYTNDNAKLYYGDKEKDLPALGEDTLDYLIYKKIFDKSVDSKNYSTVEKQVAEFQSLPKNVRTVLFNKDSDVRGLVNAYDYGVKATDYFKYKDKLKTAADRYGTSTTNSTTKLSAIASAGLDNNTITSIIKNNVFDLSSTALAVVDVMSQPPYNIPLSQVADFIYQADYTMNQKYENNDIVDLGKKSVNKTTRMLAKSLDNGSLEKSDENIQRLFSALVMESANVKGIGNGTANGTLGNLEVANALSTSSNPTIANNAEAIYNALRDKLSNYYNDWGNYSYKSEVNYLPKSAAKGYTYGRTVGSNALTNATTGRASGNATVKTSFSSPEERRDYMTKTNPLAPK